MDILWCCGRLTLVTLMVATSGLTAEHPKVTEIYRNDFTKVVEIDQWTRTATVGYPGDQWMLLIDGETRFKQEGLPPHQFLRVRMKLAILGSQDGADEKQGPDNLAILDRTGSLLMLTNFCNILPGDVADPDGKLKQSFPDEFSAARHVSATGASEVKTLGFPRDSTYDIEMVFPHTDKILELEIFPGCRNADGEEKFGIRSFELDAVSGPIVYSDAAYEKLWSNLEGKDPVVANKAVWDFIASGQAGAGYVRRKFAALEGQHRKDAAARKLEFKRVIGDSVAKLGADDFKERVRARGELMKLSDEALEDLENELEKATQPEMQAALKAAIKSIVAKEDDPNGEAMQRELVSSRVKHVLRILDIAASGRRIQSTAFWVPVAGLDDGYVPEVMSGHDVPHFSWRTKDEFGKKEWVQFRYSEAKTFDSADVFWFEDKSWNIGTKLPESWSLSYLEGDEWKPVKLKGEYTITYGKYDNVEFEPVKTKVIRLTSKAKPNHYAGLLEFRPREQKLGESEPD